MQPVPPSTQRCRFSEPYPFIWAFEFRKSTPQAVDEWVAWQDYFKHLPPVPGVSCVRTLLDFRPEGLVPLRYALQKNAEWRKQNTDIQTVPVYVAFVLRASYSRIQKTYAQLIMDGVNTFGMRSVQVELFYDDYDGALQWLLNCWSPPIS